eukprot:SAG31_NODE_173_length_21354_cov_16.826112_9_plen_341_part_00
MPAAGASLIGSRCLVGTSCGTQSCIEMAFEVPTCVVRSARLNRQQSMWDCAPGSVDCSDLEGAAEVTGWLCPVHQQWTTCGGCNVAVPYETLGFENMGALVDGVHQKRMSFRPMPAAAIAAAGCSPVDWMGRARRWCKTCRLGRTRTEQESTAAAAAEQGHDDGGFRCPIPESLCRSQLNHARDLQRGRGAAKKKIERRGPVVQSSSRALAKEERQLANTQWLPADSQQLTARSSRVCVACHNHIVRGNIGQLSLGKQLSRGTTYKSRALLLKENRQLQQAVQIERCLNSNVARGSSDRPTSSLRDGRAKRAREEKCFRTTCVLLWMPFDCGFVIASRWS